MDSALNINKKGESVSAVPTLQLLSYANSLKRIDSEKAIVRPRI